MRIFVTILSLVNTVIKIHHLAIMNGELMHKIPRDLCNSISGTKSNLKDTAIDKVKFGVLKYH